jgi:hypothetical protein
VVGQRGALSAELGSEESARTFARSVRDASLVILIALMQVESSPDL